MVLAYHIYYYNLSNRKGLTVKRSEMLSILERELRIQILEDCKINYKKAAKNLLYALEASGMEPPTIIQSPDQYNRAEGTYGFEVNEWESESES